MSAAEPGAEEQAFDYVGLAVARSVEGDALADAMRDLDGVEVLGHRTYWEIRARERLRFDFEALSEETGLDVDSELIQVLMSTYYGRIVNTDDALLLFHDPVEAMEHM